MSVVSPGQAVKVKIPVQQATFPGDTLHAEVSDRNLQAAETQPGAVLNPIPKNSCGTSAMDSQQSGGAICLWLNPGQNSSLLIFDRETRFHVRHCFSCS